MEEKPKKILYSAIVLDDISRSKILSKVPIPEGWKIIAHHMTLCLGELPEKYKHLIGDYTSIVCSAIGQAEKAIALKVESPERFIPGQAHITVAINESAGAKPKDSNEITEWTPFQGKLLLGGLVEEISQ